jgi:predicted anti-sigma-YlaC factor YlaD
MRRLMNALMLHCRKATYLIEKSNDVPLDLVERAQLNMHLSMCNGCRNYRKQNRFLERLLNRHAHTTVTPPQNTTELEDKIIRNIEEKK